MSGLHRLSTDIGCVLPRRLLPYVPLPTSSSFPSPLGVERQVQSKPEALFFLCHIHFTEIGLEFMFLPFGFRWRRAEDNEYRRDGTGTCNSGGASAEGGWDVAKSWDNKRVLLGRRKEALEGVDM